MFPLDIKKIEINKLIPHERFREDHALEVLGWLKRDGFQLRPIAIHKLSEVYEGRFLILDGHHRTEAIHRLNLKNIMANIVDYFDPRIIVEGWNDGSGFTKEEIIQIATNGRKLPPTSTKHVIRLGGEKMPFQDNDFVEPKIYTPLETLK